MQTKVATLSVSLLFLPFSSCLAQASTSKSEASVASEAAYAGAAMPTYSGTDTALWNKEGQQFETYTFFRDKLLVKIHAAKNRVALLSPFLSDADLATALFSTRLRGLEVVALLGKDRAKEYNSRHGYLAKSQIATYLLDLRNVTAAEDLTKVSEPVSLIAIDNEAWAVNTLFTDSPPRGVFVKAATVTADEVFAWQNAKTAKRLWIDFGAKKPTRTTRTRISKSGNISEYDTNETGLSRIPRRLPKQTRLQSIKNGRQVLGSGQESTGSRKLPAPPPNEVDVTE